MQDPNLKAAAQEIKAVLEKYNAAGVILLSSQTHLEYLYEITPSWSCLQVNKGVDGHVVSIRFLSKLENYKSIEEQKEIVDSTLGMVHGLAALAEQANDQLGHLSQTVSRHYGEVSHILNDERS